MRQLRNEVQRAVLNAECLLVDVHDLSIPHVAIDTDEMDFTFLEGTEREAILRLLRQRRTGLN